MKTIVLAVTCLGLVACSPPSGTSEPELIAIDVLLEPDQAMLDQASAWNARMREMTPEGFELDETHQPHITLIQRHIRADDLDEVLAEVERIAERTDLGSLGMVANGLYHIPAGELGLAGITIEPSDALLGLQQAVIDAVNQFDAGAADEGAYVPDPSGTPFDPLLFEYVQTFVPNQTGPQFNPHVTIGLAPRSWLIEQEQRPFERFEFGATGIAVFQLGNFGTASKRLSP